MKMYVKFLILINSQPIFAKSARKQDVKFAKKNPTEADVGLKKNSLPLKRKIGLRMIKEIKLNFLHAHTVEKSNLKVMMAAIKWIALNVKINITIVAHREEVQPLLMESIIIDQNALELLKWMLNKKNTLQINCMKRMIK